jgi:hypothetical protein
VTAKRAGNLPLKHWGDTTMNDLRTAAKQALEALDCPGKAKTADEQDAITTLRAALAEPVQEPFGYLWPTGRHPEFRFTQQKRDGVDGMPLYAAPPQRKPLSDEEIDELAMDEDGLPNSHLEFARAIERAHGIGEQK